MIASDIQTYASLQALTDAAETGQRPIVFWIGAGASAWAGFPMWQDLASKMHSKFVRTASGYDKQAAFRAIEEQKYPTAFTQMKDADRAAYFRDLASTFSVAKPTPVYARMLRSLEKIRPLHVLTTNVDEALERSLTSVVTVQRSDIERIGMLVQNRESFVCKLHGTSSAVESMTFSDADYQKITAHSGYLAAIRELFSLATVVFIGYSLRDEYLIKLLRDVDQQRPLFGSGPHFLITPTAADYLPDSIKQIRYQSEFADHRDALLALEIFVDAKISSRLKALPDLDVVKPIERSKSVYYLADLLPAVGQIQSSQTAFFADSDGNQKGQMIVGDGYVQSEIVVTNYSALHDLIVGLLCFDNVCFAVNRISVVHNLLGSDVFWEAVRTGALSIVHVEQEPCVLFTDENAIVGTLADIVMGDKDAVDNLPSPIALEKLIRKHLAPAPGQEKKAEDHFKLLANTAYKVSSTQLKNSFADQTKLALVSPSIRGLLGMSRGTPHASVPRWLAFPVLRLARVMAIGTICRSIDASAARMILGVERLATAAFSSPSFGKSWADDSASYVLTGRFNSDLGQVVSKTPGLMMRVLTFRASTQGEMFRKELAENLHTDGGAQVAAAINSGLRTALTPSILEQAHNQFSGLFIPSEPSSLMPAVWGNLENGDMRIAKWRERSRSLLQEEIRKHKFSPYSACPCGSGEQLKFCCMAALA